MAQGPSTTARSITPNNMVDSPQKTALATFLNFFLQCRMGSEKRKPALYLFEMGGRMGKITEEVCQAPSGERDREKEGETRGGEETRISQ